MNRRRRELLAALQPAVDFANELHEKRGPGKPIEVRNATSDTAEIMIYGTIGYISYWDDGGVTSAGMASALRDITAPNIHVRINSGGGDVFEGVAIHTLLARHNATVTTFIDGIAASAASFIAMAGDRIVSARNAMMMIHDGMTGTYGNAKTHRRAADLLDKVSDNIADMYAERTGTPADEWRALMTVNDEDGTWYTGQEALDAGLVDELTGQENDSEVADRVRRAVPAAVLAKLDIELPEEEPAVEEAPETPEEEPEPLDNSRDQGFALLAALHFSA